MCIGLNPFFDHCIKQKDSMLLWVCSVIDHRRRQNVIKTSVTHSTAACVPLLCFYHILTSSLIYYWTDTWQHRIYLLNKDSIMEVYKVVRAVINYVNLLIYATVTENNGPLFTDTAVGMKDKISGNISFSW